MQARRRLGVRQREAGVYLGPPQTQAVPPPEPPPADVMSCRDRTQEFLFACKSLQGRQVGGGGRDPREPLSDPPVPPPLHPGGLPIFPSRPSLGVPKSPPFPPPASLGGPPTPSTLGGPSLSPSPSPFTPSLSPPVPSPPPPHSGGPPDPPLSPPPGWGAPARQSSPRPRAAAQRVQPHGQVRRGLGEGDRRGSGSPEMGAGVFRWGEMGA